MADTDKTVKKDVASADGGGGLSRRQFVSGAGGLGVGAVLGGLFVQGILLPDEVLAIPASEGYILVDAKKCAGCLTCTLACSMVHEGVASQSLSRIQIERNPLAPYPNDIIQRTCRQCPYPNCVEACPTGAMHAEEKFGNVRTVDAAKCIGCQRCIEACPYTPSRVQWNPSKKHAIKCDLCADTPFMAEDGGPGGKQACVAACPMKAIQFTNEIPAQSDSGYYVKMRNALWYHDTSE